MNNTGNPVGSKAFLDFEDNVEILDKRLTSDEPVVNDRLGNPHLSWAGIEKAGTGNPAIAVDAAARAVAAAEQVEADAERIAQEAAEQAVQDVVVAVEGKVGRAEDAAVLAEAAGSAAAVNANVFPDIATGRAAVADGEQFQVAGVEEIIRYRRNSASSQTEVARYPSSQAWARVLPVAYSSKSKNLFDPDAMRKGFWLYVSDTEVKPQANSVVSGYIPVRGLDFIAVSGAPAPNPRQWAFFNEDHSEIVTRGALGTGVTGGTLRVPEGAHFFLLTVSQNQGLTPDVSTLQVEAGGQVTPYVPFVRGSIAGLGRTLVADNDSRVVVTGKGKNLFDKDAVINGWAVNVTASMVAQVPSDTIILYVGHVAGSFLTVSGLPPADDAPLNRYYNFYSGRPLSAANIVATGQIPRTQTFGTLTVPPEATWLALSPRQNNPITPDYSLTQIEVGDAVTAYEPFSPAVIAIDDIPLSQNGQSGQSGQAPYSGGVGFLFGDSITQTNNVDEGSFLYPDSFPVNNWPDYALPLIQPSACYTFAKSGASFATKPGTTAFQHFENQVTAAINVAGDEGIHPRWLVVALGINDRADLGGDYDTAISKPLTFDSEGNPTTTLDVSVPIEAARLGFARLSWHFPETIMFCSLPLQAARDSRIDQITWAEPLIKMARSYGFEVIDSFGESGIVSDFEAVGEPGRDLTDGLHTKPSGKRKQGRLIAAKIMARLQFS